MRYLGWKAFRILIDEMDKKAWKAFGITIDESSWSVTFTSIYDQQDAYSLNNMTLLSFVVMIGKVSSRSCS